MNSTIASKEIAAKKRVRVGSTKNPNISFEEFYDDISHDWHRKARALQVRRWRILKREIKGRA